ncbi:MAG TPA: cysteine hydrolase family protein [Gemmataceae bacterium]|nr:cysteine hydrolase family protein [Gemmataceae bacterium]
MTSLALRSFGLFPVFAILALGMPPARSQERFSEGTPWKLELRQRIRIPERDEFRVERRTVTWDPKKTAIIVVDMWDDHHCKSAARRVAEMAPPMNETLQAARARGVLIIHAPSDCMDAYQDTPARRRAQQAPAAKAAVPFQWNYFNPKREGPLADKLEKGGCSCDTPEPCSPARRAWKRQIAALQITDQDAVSDKGPEIFNLLQERGIDNVIVMGVHTNRCVLGRPFGIRQMVYLGKNVVLCRDLTDSYHRDPGRHFEGLREIIAHIEKYWCPTITSTSITGKPPFRFAEDRLPPDE